MLATGGRRSLGSAARLGVVAGFAGIGALLLMQASCNQPKTQTQVTVLPRGSHPVLHAVYAEELRQVMRELNAHASQQTWMQMYTTGEAPVDMSQMVDLADKMANVAANRLPQAAANVQLDPHERQIFLSLAQQLHDQAVILKQEAQRNELPAAQSTMNQIINTCNSCHTMFRGVAGPA